MTSQSDKIVNINHTRIQSVMDAIFLRMGIPDEERAIVVERLMEATLSGYNSHGVMRIPVYVSGIRHGIMVPGNKIEVLQETASVGHLDAHNGMGPVAA
ncbi:MAG: Ldh family oxidoreductase, partial [Gemmatimonadota bacterium]|nr:Ldh family oxidoreductase [Gemmatimonadota bacterium]